MARPVGIASNDPWTKAQRALGGRREIPAAIPGKPMGIARNWVQPPPPPRVQLARLMARPQISQGSGGDIGGGWGQNRGAYTTSGVGTYGSSGPGGWGYTPSGVRSSARNPGGGWGTPASGNYNTSGGGWYGGGVGGRGAPSSGGGGGWAGGGMGGRANSPGSSGWR